MTELFFEFIQVALGGKEKLSHTPTDKEWTEIFEYSQKQAVVGIAFLALDRLSNQEQKPPLKLLFDWIGQSEQIKTQNSLVNERCVEVTKLFTDAGFKTCILKGQGNALMYPEPLLRTSGDIDIWVDGTRNEIRVFVLDRCPYAQDGDMHIEFPIFKDVPVEVHYKPRYSPVPKYEKRLQKWFKNQSEEQFSNWVTLTGKSDNEVCVPTAKFNVVQQMSHIMGHFFVEGIGLRQFVDYYYLLTKIQKEECKDDFEALFDYLGMLKFARGVMWVEKDVLGLESECLIVSENEKIGRLILREIEEGGNFGKYDERYAFRKKGYLARGLTDGYRLVKLAWYFPEIALWKIVRKVENQKWKIKRV